MDWQRAIRQEHAALMRIVDLLLVLANLAELAGGRSPVVRGLVLWLLRHAEAAARDFAGAGPVLSRDTRFALMPDIPAGGGPAEAMRLAFSLRALARQLALQAKLMLATSGAHGAETQPPSLGWMPALPAIANALTLPAAFAGPSPHPAPDTS